MDRSSFILPVLLIGVLLVSGCATTKVTPLEPNRKVNMVCIQKNPDVIVPNFLDVVQDGFKRHGLKTKVYEEVPDGCKLTLTYTATRHWDMVTYMNHAELRLLNQKPEQVAYAEYHLINNGGLDFSKYSSVKSKMDPVIDRLLKEYSTSES